jgi:hypothetical protein
VLELERKLGIILAEQFGIAGKPAVVNQRGCRILDEGLGGISITNDLARLGDPLCATVIFDAPIWETAGKAAQIPPIRSFLPAAARYTAPIRSRCWPKLRDCRRER